MNSSEVANDQSLSSITPAILLAHFAQLRLHRAVKGVVCSGQGVGQLIEPTGAQDDRGDGAVCKNPSHGQSRHRRSLLLRDLLDLTDCLKLALVPIPRLVKLPKLTELCRKATPLGGVAMLVSATQESPGEGIE